MMFISWRRHLPGAPDHAGSTDGAGDRPVVLPDGGVRQPRSGAGNASDDLHEREPDRLERRDDASADGRDGGSSGRDRRGHEERDRRGDEERDRRSHEERDRRSHEEQRVRADDDPAGVDDRSGRVTDDRHGGTVDDGDATRLSIADRVHRTLQGDDDRRPALESDATDPPAGERDADGDSRSDRPRPTAADRVEATLADPLEDEWTWSTTHADDETDDATGADDGTTSGDAATLCQNCGTTDHNPQPRTIGPPGLAVTLCRRCQVARARTDDAVSDCLTAGLTVDAETCAACGEAGDVEPHAVVPPSDGGHRHDNNVVALCPDCHGGVARHSTLDL